MQNLLVDLPAPFAGKLLGSWLNLKSLCKMDSAFCSQTWRSSFLTLLGENCVLDCGYTKRWFNASTVMRWVVARKVCVWSIRMHDTMGNDSGLLMAFLTNTGSHVRKLHVDVTDYGSSTADVFAHVALHCKHLEELTCSGESKKDSQLLESLLLCSDKLTSLSLHSFALTKSLMDTIVQVGPRLIHLSLAGSLRGAQQSMQTVLAACPNLRTLNLTSCWVADATAQVVAQCCPLLIELYLADSQSFSVITDAGVLAIAELTHLRTLDLSCARHVTNAGIRALVARNKNIQQLYIGDNNNLTDVVLRAIAKNCGNITHLEVQFCDKMTDNGVIEVANKCTKMQRFSISKHKKRITDVSIQTLGNRAEVVKDEF